MLHSDDKIFLCYIKNNFESIKPIGKLPFAVVGKSMLPLFVAFMVHILSLETIVIGKLQFFVI